jgi:hypothetical protein
MRLHLRAENFDEFRIHQFVIVRDEQTQAGFAGQCHGKLLSQALFVPFFHDDDDITTRDDRL